MNFCAECGAQVATSARYCANCGLNLATIELGPGPRAPALQSDAHETVSD